MGYRSLSTYIDVCLDFINRVVHIAQQDKQNRFRKTRVCDICNSNCLCEHRIITTQLIHNINGYTNSQLENQSAAGTELFTACKM